MKLLGFEVLDLLVVVGIACGCWLLLKKVLDSARREMLSPEEENLLVCAAEFEGQLWLHPVSAQPEWVQAGGTRFVFDDKPQRTALYLLAFQRLLDLDFLRLDSANHYMLTEKGFAQAERLRARGTTGHPNQVRNP